MAASREEGPRPGSRDRVPDPGTESARPARVRDGSPPGPARSPGRTRSSWSPACSARSPPATPTAARAASAPPGSRRARAWRSSTSTTPAASNATLSPTSAPWTSSPSSGNVVFLGPPGTGKTHLATGIAIRACQAGHRVQFATASQWVDRLAAAHAAGKLQAELARLARYPLLVIDEVGYIPFEAEAANLFFQLVSGRYERASLIVTSNKPFGRWGEVFGDDTVAAAMIDRLVHHADVIALKGDSYRLKYRDLGRVPAATTRNRLNTDKTKGEGVNFQPTPRGQNSADVDRLSEAHDHRACPAGKAALTPLRRSESHGRCCLRRSHLAHDCYGLGRVNECRGPNIGRRGTTGDRGRCGSGSAAGREPAKNTTRGGGRRDHFFCAPDRSAGAAQALCSRRSAGARELADRFWAANRGGRRTVARPVRRHRLPVVHRGATGPDRPPRGPLFRDGVPGQWPVVRRHAFRDRRGGGRAARGRIGLV